MKKENGKKIELTKKDFSFVCPMKTADMREVEEGYFCAKCDKNIYDVSNFTQKEFLKLKANNHDLCITFKKVAVVSLALSFVACSTPKIIEEVPQNRANNRLTPFSLPDKNQTININHVEEENVAGGISIPSHEVEIAVGMPVLEEPPAK